VAHWGKTTMPKVSGSVRAAPRQYSGAVNRPVKGGAISAARVTGTVVVLAIMFWSIFYQNLAWDLAGFARHGPVSTSNLQDRIIKIVMLASSAYVIATRWSVARSLVKYTNVGAAALLVLCPLSALWSIDPAATVLRCISLIAIVLVCFAIAAAAWPRGRFQQLTLPPLMFILLASLVVGILMPDRIAEIGTDISQRNAWHGITHGKNEFGMFSSMAAIIFANRWLAREGRVHWSIAGQTGRRKKKDCEGAGP